MADTADVAATERQTRTLELRPRDPILVRDARPFAADPGARAVTLEWPLPITIAGALRTHAGNMRGVDWDKGGPDEVRGLEVQGPFLLRRGQDGQRRVYFPAPRDAVPYRTPAYEPALLHLRPVAPDSLPAGAGSNLPLATQGLRPVRVDQEVKPAGGAAFWPCDDTVAWLGNDRAAIVPTKHGDPLPIDVRTHVRIEPETLTQVEGALFSTEALAFDPCIDDLDGAPAEAMLCRVTGTHPWDPAPAFIRIGGEGRQAEIVPVRGDDPWPRPDPWLIEQLQSTRLLRLQLATPAPFARAWPAAGGGNAPPGWLPEWIDARTLTGKPPNWRGAAWTLISAVVGRRLPLSGWDMAYRDPSGQRGRPKRTRYAVPAGSVYFFELPAPLSAEEAAALWLRSVADRAYDRRNGFGLVLPGIWAWWQRKKEES